MYTHTGVSRRISHAGTRVSSGFQMEKRYCDRSENGYLEYGGKKKNGRSRRGGTCRLRLRTLARCGVRDDYDSRALRRRRRRQRKESISCTRGLSVAKWKVNGKCQMEIRLERRARTGVKLARGRDAVGLASARVCFMINNIA